MALAVQDDDHLFDLMVEGDCNERQISRANIALMLLAALAASGIAAQVAKPTEPPVPAPAVTQPAPKPAEVGAAKVSGSIEKVRSDVVVEKGQTVREVSVVQGNITVFGHVTGDASVVMGNLDIKPGGRVDGDAVAVMGKLIIRRGGSVGGNVN